MRNNSNLEILAKEWWEKGSHDFDEAKLSFAHGGWTDIICFHCHQAAEKYLKGFLVSRGCDITAKKYKIHDLRILLRICSELASSLEAVKDECTILNQYYIEPRYPLGAPKVYPKKEAKEAINKVEKVIAAVANATTK